MNKRLAPLDFGDWALHVLATVGAAIAAGDLMRSNEPFGIGAVIAASAVLLTWRRNRARHQALEYPSVTTGEIAAERTLLLEQRVAELEDAVTRLHDLEERLEFAERLLVRPAADAQEMSR